MDEAPDTARRAAELAARSSYGRLVALLSARSRDIAAAEDALSTAFAEALRLWPDRGVPANPEAWLFKAARNRLINAARRGEVAERAIPDLLIRAEEDEAAGEDEAFPDERLKLLFVCAHPAIDPAMRTPLMLQTVLGLDAARIGAAFLVAPATMGQRLVRAKTKIREAGLRFAVPEPEEMPDRLPEVLDAVYAAFGTGWDDIAGAEDGGRGLSEEAIHLARLLVHLLPEEPEAKGLLALMLHCEARRPARRAPDGAFVPLAEQDARLWRSDMIVEAERLLHEASAHRRFGRFQCEAAIQSVHVQRPILGRVNLAALRTLHDLLVQHAPGTGARIARAAVILEAGSAGEALAALDEMDPARVAGHQPYWATRAAVLRALGRGNAAAEALEKAIALTKDEGVRAFLARQGRT